MLLPTVVLMSALMPRVSSEPATLVFGDYVEQRSNRVYGCPCEWSAEWSSGGREAVLASRIRSGQFGGESLTGLRIVSVLLADSMLGAGTPPRRSVLFIDDAASAEQRRAGVEWVRARYGAVLGEVAAIRLVPISLDFAPDAVTMRAGTEVLVRMSHAHLPGDTQPWASLLYDPFVPLRSAMLATSLEVHCAVSDLNVSWSEHEPAITGYYGAFDAR